MGRRLEFDRDEALGAAMELFWRRGYVNTRVAQLQVVMGLGEGSFYNSFRNKRALYLECLQHYGQVPMRRRSTALATGESVRSRIHEFFEIVIEEMAEGPAPGCLVSNSLSTEVLDDAGLREHLFANIDRFLGFLSAIIREGVDGGELHCSLEPGDTARMLFTYLHGLNRLSVYRFEPQEQRRQTRAFLAAVLG